MAVLGVLIAAGMWRAGFLRPGRNASVDPSGDAIAQALRQARGDSSPPAILDSTELKSRWTPEVKGFDVSDLSVARREMFVAFANAQRCTCGCGYTLAGCRTYDPSCPVSEPRVRALLDSVRAGRYSSAPRALRKPSPGG